MTTPRPDRDLAAMFAAATKTMADQQARFIENMLGGIVEDMGGIDEAQRRHLHMRWNRLRFAAFAGDEQLTAWHESRVEETGGSLRHVIGPVDDAR